MWRALVFIGLLCVAAFGAVWLADRPGTVLITFAGYEIQMSGAALVPGVRHPAAALAPDLRVAGAPPLPGLSGHFPRYGGRGCGRHHRGPPLCQRG